ncbi:MAG TPA: peptidoglycan-associated lipoprotein Pal [Thermoanaerobaculia bacterium]|nr:peptidoglycan-associated lipoprotein Pal [Thermoanaerobaculia bacterium]
MYLRFRPVAAGALAAAACLATSCSTKPAAQVEAPPPTPTPTIVRLEPTPAPTPAPTPVAEEALPTSVDEINRRGYLKDAFFEFDKYALEPAQRDTLAGDAAWLRKHATVRATIEGHCDERGTAAYNMALGERRASAAREYLVNLGVDGSRLRTISYGKERPFATGHDEASWAQNRRAHFVVTAR